MEEPAMRQPGRSLPMLRIFLVGHSISVRRGVAALLETIEGVELVGAANEPCAALAGIAAKHADFVIVDLRLTGGSGLEVISGLARNSPPVITMLRPIIRARDTGRPACWPERAITSTRRRSSILP
ncbi:response regulator transcription factor [Paraburkholderia sp. BCC1885]|uniref:response regulator transcription factor n=1 Tax=Paraburkholderia sp. BCC1885 TaxID=2562669 RepID=UPI0028CB8C3E|nr:response regulator [Paraburkholderia sp. BCC1885]